jgi:hypothetical protein
MMSERSAEKYIGEILMETKEFPAKLWDVVITDQGFHLVFFMKPSIFEIIVMVSVWFLIFWGAIVAGGDRFAGAYLLLLVVAVYALNRYRIQNRWKKLLRIPFEKKLDSDKRNIHIPKKEIRKIVRMKNSIIIATNEKTYRLRYFENLKKRYKNGINPFEKRIEKN